MSLSCNLGTWTSWNPLGHSRPVTGLLYLTFYLYLHLFYKQFVILRRTGRDIIKAYVGLHVKCPLFTSYVNETRAFSTFSKNDKVTNFLKILVVAAELLQSRQTDRHDVANSRFRNSANAPNHGGVESQVAQLGSMYRTWQTPSQCTLPAMLTVNRLHGSLMMYLEFRNIIDFSIIRHWATLASECSGSNHSWLCTERNYFGDFRSLECSSVEMPTGNSCFWTAHLKYYCESFSCEMWNILCTCWMRTMITRGIVFPVSLFATLITYEAVLCGKIVEMLLYLTL